MSCDWAQWGVNLDDRRRGKEEKRKRQSEKSESVAFRGATCVVEVVDGLCQLRCAAVGHRDAFEVGYPRLVLFHHLADCTRGGTGQG